jgi:hypothetical protein
LSLTEAIFRIAVFIKLAHINFANKVVLGTGALRGIGRSVTQQFAQAGAQVVVYYNNTVALSHSPLQ